MEEQLPSDFPMKLGILGFGITALADWELTQSTSRPPQIHYPPIATTGTTATTTTTTTTITTHTTTSFFTSRYPTATAR